MCLQIYIKEYTGYTVTYVPDAKAVTDAPPSLLVLMKQRRRWMNGALFGTAGVVGNFGKMMSCGRSDHPWYRQCLMFLFMIYLTTLFLLQFLTVGAMFATIEVFIQVLLTTLSTNTKSAFFTNLTESNLISQIFFGFYLGLIILALFVSIALPLDRAIGYMKFAGGVFSVLVVLSVTGVSIYMAQGGFFPPE